MSDPAEYADRQIICGDCGAGYVWSAAEQAFFKARDFAPPKRCKPCREAKKAQRERATQDWEGRQ